MKIAFLFFSALAAADAGKWPDYLPKPCPRSSPDYTACLETFLRHLGPYILKGIPELNFPSMDPYYVKYFELETNFLGFDIKSVIRNSIFRGYFSANLDAVTTSQDINSVAIAMRLRFAVFAEDQNYNIAVENPVTINTKGRYNGSNYKNLTFLINCILKEPNKGDVTYLDVERFCIEPTLREGRFTMKGVSFGDKIIAQTITAFFNNDASRFFEVGKAFLVELLSKHYGQLLKIIIDQVPAEELLPP